MRQAKTKQEIVDRIRQVLRAHPYVERAELFGSLARGEAGPDSDVDQLVVYGRGRPKGFRAIGLHRALQEAMGRNVDVVQERLLHGFVRETIGPDREVVYER